MRSRRTHRFKQLFASLPADVQQQARKAYELFKRNPRHPSLHFKQVRPGVYSVRVSHKYRALGVVRGDYIVWFWIGSHDDYERMLESG